MREPLTKASGERQSIYAATENISYRITSMAEHESRPSTIWVGSASQVVGGRAEPGHDVERIARPRDRIFSAHSLSRRQLAKAGHGVKKQIASQPATV